MALSRRSLFLAVLLLAPAGCAKPDGGVAVTGTVTLDFQPLKGALVTFIPDGETPGHGGSGVTRADGKYVLLPGRGGKGIAPGLYKVTVSRALRPDGSPPDPKTPPIESDARESLPDVYSDRKATILKAAVSAETHVQDFPLQKQPSPAP